ncbi:sensory/regulatory protein RpfC [Abditibacteriota bacterium]|nr:sensory/regulatory protein RpfC [Abditibacteriota bacterium]
MNNLSCRVLLVEDNNDDYLIVRDLLSDITTTDFTLLWVDSYQAASESLLSHQYDVCLLDYRLGEANGMDLVREFGDGSIPFILLTGNEDFEVDVAAAKAGLSDFLVKGHINSPLLERSIRYAIERKKAEGALLQAQRFAQATVDALSSQIAVIDEQGTIVAVNAVWRDAADVNQYTAENAGIGTNYLHVCERSGAEGADVATGIRAVIARESENFSLEYPCHGPNDHRWFRVGVTRFPGEGPLHVVVAHENITAHKLSENALRVSEERFQSIVANVPGMVYQFTTLSDGSIEWSFISQGCREIFEAEPQLLLSNPSWLLDCIHPDDQSGFEQSMATCAETLSSWHWEGRHRCAAQEKFGWIQGMARPRRLPDGGTLWNGLITDLTALKEAEEERDRFFTMSLDLVAIAGFDGCWKRLNPAFSETLGFSASEMLEMSVLDLVHPEDRASTQEVVEKLARGESVVGFENRNRTKEGAWRWLEWQAVAAVEQGLIYAAGRDITQRRESEAMLLQMRDELERRVVERTKELGIANESLHIENIQHQLTMGSLRQVAEAYRQAKEDADNANTAKSEFLSRMSHELRTPLNAILGFGQILEMHSSNVDDQKSIAQILSSGWHLLGLVDEVLNISRIEAGHIELAIESVPLSEVVSESCAMVLPLAAQHGLTFQENVEQFSSLHVMADRQRLKQVLINLLSNAIKYNCTGGHVEVFCLEMPGGILRINVMDTGVGLSPHDQQKLFIPFERLGAMNSKIEGTGLGLTLSQGLMSAMGGVLGLESELGKGSTFWIELPCADLPLERAELTAHKLENAGTNTNAPGCNYTVLSIEDNLSNLRLLEAIFSYRPDTTLLAAMQGSIGLDMAHQHHPHLILLDLNLPDISGMEVLAQLQKSKDTSHIPVIVISADATAGQVERLLRAGAKHYLTKPLNVAYFLKTLDETLFLNLEEHSPGKRYNI